MTALRRSNLEIIALNMKIKIIISIITIAAVAYGIFMFTSPKSAKNIEVSDEAASQFTNLIWGKVIESLGQPIEGFEPEMILSVWPGIKASDFDGVEAIGGVYKTESEEVIFMERTGGVKTSADRAVTPEGMKILLGNVAQRLDLPAKTENDAKNITQSLSKQKKIENKSSTIKGKVSIGPICPVEREGVPCPVPPETYTSREMVVYKSDGKTEVKRSAINTDGTYSFKLESGSYVLDTARKGIGYTSKDLPYAFTLADGETKEFDFSIDTGIR